MRSWMKLPAFLAVARALALLAALVLPGMARAREIVVAPAGGQYTSVAAGVGAAQAGDTVSVRAGVYYEAVSFTRGGSATAGFITLRGDSGAILDGGGGPGRGIAIVSRDYIRVAGMTIRNFQGTGTPMGIDVEGSSSSIQLLDNIIYDIESPNDNAHGIAFYGTAATPMGNVVVQGNEIRNCRLGQSEALVLNGNIDGFTVAGNSVHDNDNIGIDFIGFEGTGPAGQDQARHGVCVDNVVHDISSATNPTYGGDRSADGIYVDGGLGIVIERNRVDRCDIGIEVASEHGGAAASDITVRDNFVSRGYQGDILLGGYDATRGMALNVSVVDNTTCGATQGEIVLQYNCSGVTFQNNILYSSAGQAYIADEGGNNTNVVVQNNLYFGSSVTSPGSYPDARARFVDPLLVSPLTDLHLQAASPAIDAGLDLGDDVQGQPVSGSLDIDGTPRVQGSAIDLGADEFAGALDSLTAVPEANRAPANRLDPSRPNPFHGVTAISYSAASGGRVRIRIFDASGRVVRSLEDSARARGPRVARWDGRDDDGAPVASGTYFVRLTFSDGSQARGKITIAK